MFNPSGVFAIVGYAMGAVGALVYLLGTIKKGKNDVLRQDNDDLTKSNTLLRQDKQNQEQIIATQKEMINGLKDVATQTPAVNRLIELIISQQKVQADQQKVQTEQHTKVIDKLSTLGTNIASLAKAINKTHNGKS